MTSRMNPLEKEFLVWRFSENPSVKLSDFYEGKG